MTEAPSPLLVEEPEQATAVIRGTAVPVDRLPAFFDRAFPRLVEVLGRHGVQPQGAAFALYRGMPTASVDLEVGFPVAGPITAEADVVPSALPAGRRLRSVHEGSFEGLGDSWQALTAWAIRSGLTPAGYFWEVYLTEPGPDMDPADLRTELNLPLA